MFPAPGADVFFGLDHRAGSGKVLVDLVVQVGAVGDDHEGPVADQLAQHLLGEQDHRVGFAAALRMPEDAQGIPLARAFFAGRSSLSQTSKGIVDTQILVVLGDQLFQPPGLRQTG